MAAGIFIYYCFRVGYYTSDAYIIPSPIFCRQGKSFLVLKLERLADSYFIACINCIYKFPIGEKGIEQDCLRRKNIAAQTLMELTNIKLIIEKYIEGYFTFSKIIAAPCPTPTHIVANP